MDDGARGSVGDFSSVRVGENNSESFRAENFLNCFPVPGGCGGSVARAGGVRLQVER